MSIDYVAVVIVVDAAVGVVIVIDVTTSAWIIAKRSNELCNLMTQQKLSMLVEYRGWRQWRIPSCVMLK